MYNRVLLTFIIGITTWLMLAHVVELYDLHKAWVMVIGYWFYPAFQLLARWSFNETN